MGRSLAWRQDQVDADTMTVESCLTACKAGGYSIAGLEYASECYWYVTTTFQQSLRSMLI